MAKVLNRFVQALSKFWPISFDGEVHLSSEMMRKTSTGSVVWRSLMRKVGVDETCGS